MMFPLILTNIVINIIVTILVMMNLLSTGKACNEKGRAAKALEYKGEAHREQAEERIIHPEGVQCA